MQALKCLPTPLIPTATRRGGSHLLHMPEFRLVSLHNIPPNMSVLIKWIPHWTLKSNKRLFCSLSTIPQVSIKTLVHTTDLQANKTSEGREAPCFHPLNTHTCTHACTPAHTSLNTEMAFKYSQTHNPTASAQASLPPHLPLSLPSHLPLSLLACPSQEMFHCFLTL